MKTFYPHCQVVPPSSYCITNFINSTQFLWLTTTHNKPFFEIRCWLTTAAVARGGRCRLFYVSPSQLASGAPRRHNTFHESKHCPEAQTASMVWSGPHVGWILRQTFGNWAQFSKVSWQESSIPKIFPLIKCHTSIWMCWQSFLGECRPIESGY